MRIVIAGSSGHLGGALRRRLEGHDLVRLVRRTPGDGDEIQWDPYRGPLDPVILDGADAVINLGGVPIAGQRWNEAYKQRIRVSRVIPTTVLSEAVAAARTPVMISASAAGWYGDRADVAVDESTPAAADFLGRTCLEWEQATAAAAEAGTRVVRLRTGHVLGPDSALLAKFVPVFKLCLGGRFGSGRQYQPWISERDWAAAVEFTLTREVTGPVNLVGPNPTTNREFARALGAALGRPAPWPIPGWAVKLVAGEAAVELLRGAKIIPKVLRDHDFTYQDERLGDALRWSLDR